MRKISALILSMSILLSAGLDWTTSYKEAVAKANKEHKAVMVYIEADDCAYCDRLKKEILSKPYITKTLKNFIPLVLNINSKDTKAYFPKAFVTPTIYFITPDNKLLEEIIGQINEEFFFWRVDSAEKEARKAGVLK